MHHYEYRRILYIEYKGPSAYKRCAQQVGWVNYLEEDTDMLRVILWTENRNWWMKGVKPHVHQSQHARYSALTYMDVIEFFIANANRCFDNIRKSYET